MALFIAKELCAALFGPDFAGDCPVPWAFCLWVPALSGILGCLLHGLNAVGKTLGIAKIFGANLVLNVALNLWLIPHYGIVASAGVSGPL